MEFNAFNHHSSLNIYYIRLDFYTSYHFIKQIIIIMVIKLWDIIKSLQVMLEYPYFTQPSNYIDNFYYSFIITSTFNIIIINYYKHYHHLNVIFQLVINLFHHFISIQHIIMVIINFIKHDEAIYE